MSASGRQKRVNQEKFEIEVTSQSVKVRLNASKKSPRGRFYWSIFFVAVWIAVFPWLCLPKVSVASRACGMTLLRIRSILKDSSSQPSYCLALPLW